MPELQFQLGKKFKILAVLICWALIVFLFLFAMTNKFSRMKTTDSTRIQEQKYWEQDWEKPETTNPISCDRTHYDYEICYLNRPTTLDPTTATFFTEDPINSTHRSIEKIRPYPRNFQHTPFDHVRELTLTTAPSNAPCNVTHNSPALVFSAGAWPGNFYHDFNENFIPLFITVDRFFPDHDFVIGIFNCSEWWLRHYMDLLSGYTRHQVLNLDEEKAVHCFPSAIVGLISHGASTVDPTLQRGPRPKTLHDFRAFVAATYSKSHASHARTGNKTTYSKSHASHARMGNKTTYSKSHASHARMGNKTTYSKSHASHARTGNKTSVAVQPPLLPWRLEGRPRLVLLNRKGARTILNIEKVYRAALEVGFDVVVHEPSRETLLHEDFRLIDSSHALIGVHGAGLTNMLFLRKGSVLMQLAPKESEWLGSLFYGKMAIRLGLEYMVYDLGGDESLLGMDKATKERLARQGGSLENWVWYKELKIKLDVRRFKKYLKRAYKKAKIFMQKESLKGNYYSKMGQQLKILGRKFKVGY